MKDQVRFRDTIDKTTRTGEIIDRFENSILVREIVTDREFLFDIKSGDCNANSHLRLIKDKEF